MDERGGSAGIIMDLCGRLSQANRVLRDALKPSKIRRGHEDEFDSDTLSWERPSDQSSTARSLTDFQRDLNLASDGHGNRHLNEATAQADTAHDATRCARPSATCESGRYLAAQTTEGSSFHWDTGHGYLTLPLWMIL